jgi:hypothetical protein
MYNFIRFIILILTPIWIPIATISCGVGGLLLLFWWTFEGWYGTKAEEHELKKREKWQD